MTSTVKTVVLVLALCLAGVQASAIGRKGVVESKDSVDVTDNGITIKSVVDTYVQSKTALAESRKDDWPESSLDIYKTVFMYHLNLLPALGLKIAKVVLHFALALFVGIGATTAVCNLTPLCSITYNINKPAFMSDKNETFPAIKEAFEVFSRFPNLFKKQKKPELEQPERTTEAVDDELEEFPKEEQDIDARTPRKQIDAESHSAKSDKLDHKENEA